MFDIHIPHGSVCRCFLEGNEDSHFRLWIGRISQCRPKNIWELLTFFSTEVQQTNTKCRAMTRICLPLWSLDRWKRWCKNLVHVNAICVNQCIKWTKIDKIKDKRKASLNFGYRGLFLTEHKRGGIPDFLSSNVKVATPAPHDAVDMAQDSLFSKKVVTMTVAGRYMTKCYAYQNSWELLSEKQCFWAELIIVCPQLLQSGIYWFVMSLFQTSKTKFYKLPAARFSQKNWN